MASGEAAWNHGYVEANGVRVHYVRQGAGMPLVLLHGWPEFWFVWRKNIPALAKRFDVIAPDLRGFGESEKPSLPEPPGGLLDELVEDLRGIADALGIERFGIVSHDVGSWPRGSRRGTRRGSLGCSSLTVFTLGSGVVGWNRRA